MSVGHCFVNIVYPGVSYCGDLWGNVGDCGDLSIFDKLISINDKLVLIFDMMCPWGCVNMCEICVGYGVKNEIWR